MSLIFNAIHRTGQVGFNGSRALEGETFLIGRGPDNDWIVNDEDCVVSKRHCVVEDSGGVYVIRDTSTNGVFINGMLVGKDNCRSLADGDCIEVGTFAFRIEINGDAPLAEDDVLGPGIEDAVTAPAIPFADSQTSDITGGGLKSLLDDIAASAGTASSILPGINDTALPKSDTVLDIDRKVNRIGWDEPPAIKPIAQTAPSDIDELAEVALERALMPSPLPQREDTPGLNTVVRLSTAVPVLPDDWHAMEDTAERPQQTPVMPAAGSLDLVRAFARAANLGEADIGLLIAAIEAGKTTPEAFFSHAGGLLRQSAAAIEERLSTCRSKAQSLEYTMPAKAIEHVQAALDRAEAAGTEDRPNAIIRDLVQGRHAPAAQTALARTVQQTQTLDAAIFTTLLSVSALSFGGASRDEAEPAHMTKKAG